jgi:formylglycine-generating enzyme required for sulfatase activity
VLPHLSFEEYLAACHLEYREDEQLAYQQWATAADRWREVLLLLMGRLVRQNKFGMIVLWLNRLLMQRCGKVDKAHLQRQRDALFAPICYAEVGRRTYLEDRVDVLDLEQRLAFALVDVLQHPAAELQTAERIEAGFLLGDLGDPRIPVTVEQWQRELARVQAGDSSGYFCKVEAGTYLIGSSDDDPDAEDEEKPQHRVTFAHPFWIARFPITNAQWQAWVQQGGKDSHYADDTDRNRPNQPVVGVSWYVSNEFCAWLSKQLGREVRLPTEAEWEAAARGLAGRRYPWGNTWQEDCAATEEDRETRGWPWSVPVGCYPQGAAGCGALDMAGNVWEWTADVWRSHPGAEELFEYEDRRVLKGGSYGNNRTYVRCAARGRGYPDLGNGFRLVLSP